MTPFERKVLTMYLQEDRSVEQIVTELGSKEEIIELIIKKVKKRVKSNIEQKVGDLLRNIYPKFKIEEQKKIGDLFLDYYIHAIRLGIEVQGIQHFKTTPFFHGKHFLQQEANFEHGQRNDLKKSKLAHASHIYILYVNHDDDLTEDNLRKIIYEHSPDIVSNLSTFVAETRLFQQDLQSFPEAIKNGSKTQGSSAFKPHRRSDSFYQ